MSTTAQTAAAAPPPPTGPRRGGRRGGAGGRGGKSAGASISAAAAQPDDTEEVRKLRAKYADKLSLLRELFPDWTDEDLLFALQEAGGEMELAVGRISEGHAEQFSSVKSKKQVKKDVGSTPTPTTFQGATAPSSTAPGSTQASRGGRGGIAGARGGRGGAARGARGGGRGGIRGAVGGRGGSSLPLDGRATDASAASSNNVQSTPTGATWADTVAATSSKSNGAAGGSWGDDTEGLDLKTSSAPAPSQTTATASSEAKPTQETPVEKVEETREEPGIVASTLAKIIPSKLVPKGSKMSWAQIARPADPPKAAAVPEKKTEELHPAAKKPVVEDIKPATEAVPAPAVAPAEVDPPAVSAVEPQPANTANVGDASGAAEILPASTLPPGLSSDNEPATAGDATSKTSAGAGKPGMGRSAQSQRAIQRAKQQEAVVMAKSNAPYDNLGVRFGSLNFLGGEDNEAETGGTAPTADSAAVPASDPHSAGSGVYAEQQAQEPAQATTAPAQVAQQTQTAPTHQDAYAQATTSPYNGKQEATNAHQYGYQQGLAQHQQAHQAAVAQAQAQAQQSTPAAGQQQPYQQAAAPVASSGYGAAQSGGQQQQALPSQYGDYYGGLDSQRLSSFYGNYDQQSAHASRGNEDRGATNAAGPQQSATSADAHQVQHGTHPSAAQAAPQQQQHFPNVMPYYYPHYYLPNQFQHYGQPGAGYGQYGLYGQQPPQQQQQQHPSKPATPAAVHSSYSQNGPADVSSGAGAYGSGAAGGGQYSQSPGVSSALTSGAGSGYNDSSFGRHGGGNDYSKLYASSASPAAPASSQQGQHSNSIPGLGGFLGQSPAPSNGNVGGAQMKNGSSNALESAYRQYDNGKVGTPTQQHQQQQQQGSQPQAQTQQQQHQQQQQQQQQYYQQYNAYAAHQQQQQQPSAGTGSYQNYPYRQYWG